MKSLLKKILLILFCRQKLGNKLNSVTLRQPTNEHSQFGPTQTDRFSTDFFYTDAPLREAITLYEILSLKCMEMNCAQK